MIENAPKSYDLLAWSISFKGEFEFNLNQVPAGAKSPIRSVINYNNLSLLDEICLRNPLHDVLEIGGSRMVRLECSAKGGVEA